MVPLLALAACLEKVSGENVPLDPRFYEGGDAGQGSTDPNAGPGSADGAWLDWEGERVTVPFVLVSPESLPLQVDVAEPDASVEGGLKRAGMFHLDLPGKFDLLVPVGVKAVHVEVFQDITGDGPTEDDPFAQVDLDLTTVPTEPQTVTLVEGGRGVAGAPRGASGEPNGAWLDWKGEVVVVTGVVSADDASLPIRIDISVPNAAVEGGIERVGILHLDAPGPFELPVPTNVASVQLAAFQDLGQPGPDESDPYAEARLDMAAPPSAPLALSLKPGARGAPGSGGGGGGGPGGGPAFPEGPKITLSGTAKASAALPVKIDLFKLTPETAAGREFLFKLDVNPDGGFTVDVPVDYGSLELEAYQDINNNGPDGEDPKGRAGPIAIGSVDIPGVTIELP